MSVPGNLKKNPLTAKTFFLFLLVPPLMLMLYVFFAGSESKAYARAEIRDIVVSNSRQDLLLYLHVDKAFRAEIEEGIFNGIPVLYTFLVSLREIDQAGRPGRQVAGMEFAHALSYDALKEVFNLRFSEGNTAVAVDNFDKAKALMTEVNGVKVVELARLKPGTAYFLSIKVRLERENLPLFFQYLIPFWQLRGEETDWQYVQFRY
ncbi:MAG: DUF4390 domain-containing protein [Desulfurivibrionaceae bacterium]|nr:DUF4390 domain-containing protein [Desulfobulbales bacterium]MDT8334483.1 DUF4390 domain-containing protein [Desulfurivibrionaceae bacterium]